MQARRDWHEIFQVMKSKDIQVRPLYLERHSFKMKSEIKSFPDTPPPKRLKKVHLHQTSISRDAKGATLRRRNGEREEHRYRGEEWQQIIIITFNINGLSVPIKRHRVAEWIENMTYMHSVYKGPTSKQKICTSWKWRDGKNIVSNWRWKES